MRDTNYLYEIKNKRLFPLENLHGLTVLREPIFLMPSDKDPMIDVFYNNISHELRTPLNVVLGSLQLFDMMGDDLFQSYNRNKFKAYNNLMKKNCFRLLRVINNLIDSSKFESGNFSLCLANRNIVETLEKIFNEAKPYAAEKGIKIKLKTKSKKIITAYDEDKFSRSILNIISNAIKFTSKKGSINISIREKDRRIYIAIKDTGIGIPEDKKEKIFDRFMQVDSTLSRSYEGSGLGLSIANSLVKLHGGMISVKSQLGKGSTFTIELPVRIIEEVISPTTVKKDDNHSLGENAKIELSDTN